jgi:PAS domain S-box-containing protein
MLMNTMKSELNFKWFILTSCTILILLGLSGNIYALFINNEALAYHPYNTLPIAIGSAFCFTAISVALLIKTLYQSKKSALLTVLLLFTSLLCSCISLLYSLNFKAAGIIVMTPYTSLCFIILCTSLLLCKSNTNCKPAQYLLNIVTLIAFVFIVGHLFEVPEFELVMAPAPMPLNTACGFLLFSIAASLSMPSAGIISIFTANKTGNLVARRLFLRLVLFMLVIGYLRIALHRYSWVSMELGGTITITLMLLISLGLIYSTSITINESQEVKNIAEPNFRLAVESAPYALVISDSDGKILLVNQETEKLYGYSREELVGESVKIIIPRKMHEGYDLRREQFFKDDKAVKMGAQDDDQNMLALKKDGTEFPIEIILTPIQSQSGAISLASVIDITERKMYENLVKEQIAQLQSKNNDLEQINYISSHDLQEPLRTVTNYIELLTEDYPEQIDGEIKMHLEAMQSSVNRMGKVVNSLLEFGKLGYSKNLTLTDCNTLVKNVTDDLNSLITSSGAVITVADKLPVVYAYDLELRQLFQNLINNAVKFQYKGITPKVVIGVKEIAGYYEFYIKDNGIGIPEQHLENVFTIFERLHNQEDYNGYGVGLANCKKVAEMHGGNIWAESSPGKGSTFKFTILNIKA